jgi:hypothetical protein
LAGKASRLTSPTKKETTVKPLQGGFCSCSTNSRQTTNRELKRGEKRSIEPSVTNRSAGGERANSIEPQHSDSCVDKSGDP